MVRVEILVGEGFTPSCSVWWCWKLLRASAGKCRITTCYSVWESRWVEVERDADMSLFVIVLILCSSFMHAGWNLLAHRERSETVFYHRMLLLTAVIGFVPGVVYPITRSLPVLIVGFGDMLRGRYVTPVGWVGMLLVVCGCILVPLRSFGDFAQQRYFNRANLWMFFTALGWRSSACGAGEVLFGMKPATIANDH